MFRQTDIDNLFLKRSGVIYDTTNKKKSLPPEFTEFILVLHGILLLTHHPVSTDDTVFSTNWTSAMDHLQMFLMNDGPTEDVQAASRVLVAHRYNCIDKPLNVSAQKELYVTKGNNKVTSKLVTLATLPPTKDATNLHQLCAYRAIKVWMGNPVLYGWKEVQGELYRIHPPSRQHQSPWWR